MICHERFRSWARMDHVASYRKLECLSRSSNITKLLAFAVALKSVSQHHAGGVAGAAVRESVEDLRSCGGSRAGASSTALSWAGCAPAWRSCHRALLFDMSRMDTLQHCMAWLWKRIWLEGFVDQPRKTTVTSFLPFDFGTTFSST